VINRRVPSVRHRLAEQLRYGHVRSDRRAEAERLLAEFLAPGIVVLPFDAEDATHAGDIRAHLESKGTRSAPMII
jgi:tRNA(fMet)-specific endonuclease VapC